MANTENIESTKELVQSKEGSLNNSVPRFAYPKTIESNSAHTSYLIFHIVKPAGLNTLNDRTLKAQQSNFLKSPVEMKTIGMIQLYMPAITESLNHEYAKSDTTLFADLAKVWVDAPGTGILDKTMNSAAPGFERIVDKVQQVALNNPSSVQTFGQIHGQRQSLLYGGTTMRQQTFTFALRPRNLAELKDIGEIIHMFRKYSSGSHASSTLATALDVETLGTIDTPPIWFVEERIKKGQSAFRYTDKFMMGPAAITSVKINKTPDQISQTLANTAGDPVAIELEIQLQEMVPVYSDFWDTLNENRNRRM